VQEKRLKKRRRVAIDDLIGSRIFEKSDGSKEKNEPGHIPKTDINRKTGPMSGFNTEIKHMGSAFHVQTQDQGITAHYVESIIYRSGKVLSSRRTYYTSFLNSPALQGKICEIIQEQHSSILREITEGRFDHLQA
jgi:hypothetical protein